MIKKITVESRFCGRCLGFAGQLSFALSAAFMRHAVVSSTCICVQIVDRETPKCQEPSNSRTVLCLKTKGHFDSWQYLAFRPQCRGNYFTMKLPWLFAAHLSFDKLPFCDDPQR